MAQTAAAAQASQASQAAMAAAQQAAAQQTLNKAAMDAANAATAAMGLMGALPAAAGENFKFFFCYMSCLMLIEIYQAAKCIRQFLLSTPINTLHILRKQAQTYQNF